MEQTLLNEDLKNKNFARIYFLYGDENFIVDFYVNRLIQTALTPEEQTFDLHRHGGAGLSAGELISQMQAFPMLAKKKVIAVEDLPLSSEAAKALLTDDLLNDDTVLILYASGEKYDRTKKEFKEMLAFARKNGRAAAMDALDRTDKERWVKKHFTLAGREISPADVSYFLDSVNNEMYALASEIAKLAAYTAEKTAVTRQDIDAVCIKTADARAYELTNAITAKDPKTALAVIKTLFDNGQNENLLAAALFSAVALLYRTQKLAAAGMNIAQIAKITGGRDFVIKKNLALLKTWPENTAGQMLEACAECDLTLKTGTVDPQTALEQLAMKCILLQTPKTGGRAG